MAMIQEAATRKPGREASYDRIDAFGMAPLWEAARASHCPAHDARPTGSLALSECLPLPDRRGVVMTMSEYEERFRAPAPSLHQIFAAIRGPNATRRRSRRFWGCCKPARCVDGDNGDCLASHRSQSYW
jgi:hypothetical protein